jgi:hypothetical protein
LDSSSTAALPWRSTLACRDRAAVAPELGQRLGRFLARQQHGVAEMAAALGIGQELVEQDALVDLDAVLVRLLELGLGLDLALVGTRPGHDAAAS